MELERVLLEKSDVQETLVKLETVCSSLEHDKKRLKDEIKKVIPSVHHHLMLLCNFSSFCCLFSSSSSSWNLRQMCGNVAFPLHLHFVMFVHG